MAKVVVVGSSNTDMVVLSDRLPARGETVIGGEFLMVAGGKGANQAVAAARLGGDVTFIARVGSDVFGERAVEGFRADGIDTRFVTADPDAPSGVALILVQKGGENSIAVAPGANRRLTPEDVRRAASAIEAADVLLMQLETPVETVAEAARIAKAAGTTVILNPAPAADLPASLLRMVDVLTPNETEASRLAGTPAGARATETAGRKLLGMGVGLVVLTLGARGAAIVTAAGIESIPAHEVDAVDATAAGDAFNGALSVSLGDGRDPVEAVRFAVAAASLSVTKLGAQPSLPTLAEVTDFRRNRGC